MNTDKIIKLHLLMVIIVCSCSKNDQTPADNIKYFPLVRSIINNNCSSCHRSDGTWQGRPVKFDNDADIAAQYQAIKKSVADPVSPTNKRMPENAVLSASDISKIVKWFDKGGKVTD